MSMSLTPCIAIVHTIEFEFSVLPKLAKEGECDTGYQVDALLCELVPGFTRHIEAFYNDDGPPLRDLCTKQDLALLDRYLVQVLRRHRKQAA